MKIRYSTSVICHICSHMCLFTWPVSQKIIKEPVTLVVSGNWVRIDFYSIPFDNFTSLYLVYMLLHHMMLMFHFPSLCLSSLAHARNSSGACWQSSTTETWICRIPSAHGICSGQECPEWQSSFNPVITAFSKNCKKHFLSNYIWH